MMATLSGGACESLHDAALLQFLEQDRRPTFVLDFSNNTTTIVYQNPACKYTFPDLPQRDWAATFGTDAHDVPDFWTFSGKLWMPTVLYQRWAILSTCCRRDEVGPLIPNLIATPDGYTLENHRAVNPVGQPTFASDSEVKDFRELEQSIAKSLEFEGPQGPPISLAQYRRSFKSAPLGIYATDSMGEPIFCNDAYYRIIGEPKQRGGSIPVFFDYIHHEDVDQLRVAKRQAMITKKPITLEYRLNRPWHTIDPVSGREICAEFWVLGTIVPWLDDLDNQKINYVNGWLIDISAQRYHERRRVIAAQQEKAEKRFARMADSAPVGMYMFKPDLTPVYMNEACFEVMGTSREHFMETSKITSQWDAFVHEESLEEVKEATRKMFVNGSGTLTYRLKKPHKYLDPATGTEIVGSTWVNSFSVVDKNEAGEPISVQGFIQDISAKQLSQQLLKQRLEEALETKKQADRFIDMTSHELRNPLSAILQSADGILASFEQSGQNKCLNLAAETAETVVNLAQTIIHCAQHQKTIVDDILTLSKLDSNLLVISPDQTLLPKLINKCFRMYAAETEAAQIAVSLDVEPSFKKVVGNRSVMLDSSRVLQVVINLFSNAIKFTKLSSKRHIGVSLGASTSRPTRASFVEPHKNLAEHSMHESDWGQGEEIFVQIAVSDTGRGIDLDESRQLFQRFSQASPKTYKQYGGSGLGLYISQSLTELQGGQIGVESQGVGKGSTFIFYIKARLCASEPDQRSRHTSRTVSPLDSPAARSAHRRVSASLFSDLQVLVVEDNIINQKVMAQQLQRFGCTVHVANHGLEALEFLQKTTFWHANTSEKAIPLSVILMDVEMPILNGLDCVQRIRALQRDGKVKGHVPVIAITANARGEQIGAAVDSGMDSVVTKPFRVSELVPRMRELVGRLLVGDEEMDVDSNEQWSERKMQRLS